MYAQRVGYYFTVVAKYNSIQAYFSCSSGKMVDIIGVNRRKMPILRMKVANPPKERPVMLYDGNCSFCRRTAFYMRGLTRRQVDFASYHTAQRHFPEIDLRYLAEEVKLVAPSGYVYSGAEAVFKALHYGHRWEWLFSLYEALPPFRWISEMVYRHVARNRDKYSKRVGPFWIDWDSGGEAYEADNSRQRAHRTTAPTYGEMIRKD
jgi:predicted DCC family thiol-disulfide oxidoreductase YuxK